jgi:hypothetical protein
MGFWDEDVELLEQVIEAARDIKTIADKLEASTQHKGLINEEVEALINAVKPFKEIEW